MSSSAGAAAVGGAMAGVAAMEAERAAEEHRQACIAMMPTYADAGASVESKRAYAGCVETVYPEPVSPEGHRALQLICIIALVAAALGFALIPAYDLFDRFIHGVLSVLGALALVGLAAFLCWVFLG